jgi:hypothetical protein
MAPRIHRGAIVFKITELYSDTGVDGLFGTAVGAHASYGADVVDVDSASFARNLRM